MDKTMDSLKIAGGIKIETDMKMDDRVKMKYSISNHHQKQLSGTTQLLQDDNDAPINLTIQVEHRKFCLSLEKLDKKCRKKIIGIFAQKQYSLEELLTLFVTTLRDQSVAEQELINILYLLESKCALS